MHVLDEKSFLERLEAEATLQAQIYHRRLLPEKIDVITSFIGRYSWQTLVVTSGLTAALFTWMTTL